MSEVSFKQWMINEGDIFAGETVATQTRSKDVNAQAGGNDYSPATKKPKIQSTDIGVRDTGVTTTTIQAYNQEQGATIRKPTIHEPFVHDVVVTTSIADEHMDIFTPSISLTDIFGVGMNPDFTIR